MGRRKATNAEPGGKEPSRAKPSTELPKSRKKKAVFTEPPVTSESQPPEEENTFVPPHNSYPPSEADTEGTTYTFDDDDQALPRQDSEMQDPDSAAPAGDGPFDAQSNGPSQASEAPQFSRGPSAGASQSRGASQSSAYDYDRGKNRSRTSYTRQVPQSILQNGLWEELNKNNKPRYQPRAVKRGDYPAGDERIGKPRESYAKHTFNTRSAKGLSVTVNRGDLRIGKTAARERVTINPDKTNSNMRVWPIVVQDWYNDVVTCLAAKASTTNDKAIERLWNASAWICKADKMSPPHPQTGEIKVIEGGPIGQAQWTVLRSKCQQLRDALKRRMVSERRPDFIHSEGIQQENYKKYGPTSYYEMRQYERPGDHIAEYGKSENEATQEQLDRRIADGFKGKGAYFGRLLGGAAGSLFGGAGGGGFGSMVGDSLENQALDWYRGKGGYGTPRFHNARDFSGRIGNHIGGSGGYYNYPKGAMSPEDRAYHDHQARLARLGEPFSSREEYEAAAMRPDGTMAFEGLATNSLIDAGAPWSRKPHVMQTADDETGDLYYSGTEYLQDIDPTSSDFQTQMMIQLNAGLDKSFPDLSRFAREFEEYKFEQLLFFYRTLVTPGNNTASGTVSMAVVYNSSSQPYTDKRSIDNAGSSSVSKSVTNQIELGIECDPRKSASGAVNKYVRMGDLPQGVDLHSYDYGYVQIATVGAHVPLVCGEIWVRYKVRLCHRRNMSAIPLSKAEGWTFTTHGRNVAPRDYMDHFLMTNTDADISPTFPFRSWGQDAAGNNVAWFDPTTGSGYGTDPVNTDASSGGQSALWIDGYNCSPNVQISGSQATRTLTTKFQAVPQGVYTFSALFTYYAVGAGASSAGLPAIAGVVNYGSFNASCIGNCVLRKDLNGAPSTAVTCNFSTGINTPDLGAGNAEGRIRYAQADVNLHSTGQQGGQCTLSIAFPTASMPGNEDISNTGHKCRLQTVTLSFVRRD